MNYEMPFFEVISKSKNIDMNMVKDLCINKARFIYETYETFQNKLKLCALA